MELKLAIGFNQLVDIIKQLLPAKKYELRVELVETTVNSKEKSNKKFQELLLNVWS